MKWDSDRYFLETVHDTRVQVLLCPNFQILSKKQNTFLTQIIQILIKTYFQLTLQLLEDSHLHLQHLLGLPCRLYLEGDLFLGDQVQTLVYFTETTSTYFLYHLMNFI